MGFHGTAEQQHRETWRPNAEMIISAYASSLDMGVHSHCGSGVLGAVWPYACAAQWLFPFYTFPVDTPTAEGRMHVLTATTVTNWVQVSLWQDGNLGSNKEAA